MKELEIAEVIQALRTELYQAVRQATPESIRFDVESIDVEFETAIERSVEGELSGKIKFLVVNADAKGSGKYANTTTHKIKLSLKPVLDSGQPNTPPQRLQVGGDS